MAAEGTTERKEVWAIQDRGLDGCGPWRDRIYHESRTTAMASVRHSNQRAGSNAFRLVHRITTVTETVVDHGG